MPFFRKQVGRQTLRVHCDACLAVQAEWLLDTVATFEGCGKGLANGVTVQVGWSLLRLQQDGPELAVCEPDFAGNPFRDVRDDVSCTLTVLLRQNHVLSQVDVEGVTARFDEKVVLARGCLECRRVYAQRQEPGPGDTGWYVGPADGEDAPDAEDLEARWLFQILTERPRLLDAMSLPVGYLVVWDGDRIEGVLDPEDRNVWTPGFSG